MRFHSPAPASDSRRKSSRNKSLVGSMVAKQVRVTDDPPVQFGRRSACPTICLCYTLQPRPCGPLSGRAHHAACSPWRVRADPLNQRRRAEDCPPYQLDRPHASGESASTQRGGYIYRGNGLSIFASAYATTATTAEFSANACGTILSRVSAAV